MLPARKLAKDTKVTIFDSQIEVPNAGKLPLLIFISSIK